MNNENLKSRNNVREAPTEREKKKGEREGETADKCTKKEGWCAHLNGGRGGSEAGECEVAANTCS